MSKSGPEGPAKAVLEGKLQAAVENSTGRHVSCFSSYLSLCILLSWPLADDTWGAWAACDRSIAWYEDAG